MQITEVRIKLMNGEGEHINERLLAFASIAFDGMFVVRDLKIIDGKRGEFIAMPSRKLMDRCRCGTKNPLRSRHCSHCGVYLNENRAASPEDGRVKLHADIAHPISTACRTMIERAVFRACPKSPFL